MKITLTLPLLRYIVSEIRKNSKIQPGSGIHRIAGTRTMNDKNVTIALYATEAGSMGKFRLWQDMFSERELKDAKINPLSPFEAQRGKIFELLKGRTVEISEDDLLAALPKGAAQLGPNEELLFRADFRPKDKNEEDENLGQVADASTLCNRKDWIKTPISRKIAANASPKDRKFPRIPRPPISGLGHLPPDSNIPPDRKWRPK